MLRRKFMQLMLVASFSSALALVGTTARASGGASSNDSGGGASVSSGGASRSGGGASISSGGASRSGGGRASIYCATDANGQQNCQQETSDGLSSVNDSDLDDVLKSFN